MRAAVNSAAQGIANVQECLSWMKPRKMDAGFLSSLARLGVEVDAKSRAWNTQRLPYDVVEDIPRDPMHTAEAVSLMLRLVRSLPGSLPLRSMLEPLTQVLLRAIYCDWSWVPSLADCEEAEVALETIMKLVPFYALIKGHQGLTEAAKEEAQTAITNAESLRATTAVAVSEAAVAVKEAAEFKEKCKAETKARTACEKELSVLQEAYKNLHNDMRKLLLDFTEVLNKNQDDKEAMQDLLSQAKRQEASIAELQGQVHTRNSDMGRMDEDNNRMRAQLLAQKADIDQVPHMREQLAAYESTETVQGVAFAVRIANEVLGLQLVDICGQTEIALTRRSTASNVGQMRNALDTVCSKVKALPIEISQLKREIKNLNQQVTEYRQLIPIWNQDVMEDLEDACNQDAPVHRQVFSMKDCRSFAGLGTGDDVPLYLRAEGFVRHLSVSKGELEDFMQDFTDFFFSRDIEHDMSTEAMHLELYQHMKLRFQEKSHEHPEALTEFSYTFICSLEAYRDDPDFELFDLMLSGAVHPSIMKDQRSMLQNIESLLRACQEATGSPEEERSRKKHHGEKKEQVSRRVIRAALEVIFPDKTAARHEALRLALYVTIQMLSDDAKTPSPDCAYTGDLFAATADGSQTPLVEEIRRQHVYEVIEWTAELSRRLLKGRGLGDRDCNTTEKQLANIIMNVDPDASVQYCKDLARIGCPSQHESFQVREVLRRLRHGILLRPTRLWLRCEPKEVVRRLMTVSQVESGTADEDDAAEHIADGITNHSREAGKDRSQRLRALKVLDNPVQVMNSDEYNDPDMLEQVITRAPQRVGK